jgi:glutaredoxin-related protein
MILWINGTLGAGKTSTANELVELLPHARINKPEQVGYMLRHVLTEPVNDFQDWPPWRQLVVQTAAQVHDYVGGILVTPMTLLRRDYLQEIFDGLATHDLTVRHVLVHADPGELARHINQDQGVPEQTRRWRLDYLRSLRVMRRLRRRSSATTWPNVGLTTSCCARLRLPGPGMRTSPSSGASVPWDGGRLVAATPSRLSTAASR